MFKNLRNKILRILKTIRPGLAIKEGHVRNSRCIIIPCNDKCKIYEILQTEKYF
jgi:hypothetical protein